VKKHSEIIKEFGLFSLLFVLVSAVAVSDNTNGEFTDTAAIFGNDSVSSYEKDTTLYESTSGETSEISVTVVETSLSEDVDDTNTGEGTDPEDSQANDNQNSSIAPPNTNPDELTYEEWRIDEWWEWVLSTVTSEDIMLPPLPLVEDTIDFTTTGDLP